jgi:hypothetical protein
MDHGPEVAREAAKLELGTPADQTLSAAASDDAGKAGQNDAPM